MHTAVVSFRQLPRARQAAALGVGLAVMLGHAWVLQASGTPAAAAMPARVAAMQVRQIVANLPPAPVALPTAAPAAPPTAVPAGRAGPLPAAAAPAAARPRVKAAAVAVVAPRAPIPNSPPSPTTPAAAPDTPPLQADRLAPTYATALPPAVSLHYRVQRGERLGHAELHWAPEAQGYRLSLLDDLAPKGVTGRASRGRLTEHGLAPERFAELRRERELRAANFDAEAGQVSFSSSPLAHAWPAGGQDRLSWWIQLAAVVQAAPERFGAGQRIELPVVGTRGDPEVWAFEVLGREAVALGHGAPQPLLALVRQPARLYDARVQVWLDPQQHHLPVRLRFSPVPRGETLELTLLTAGATRP